LDGLDRELVVSNPLDDPVGAASADVEPAWEAGRVEAE
jgi:hypothetical protein